MDHRSQAHPSSGELVREEQFGSVVLAAELECLAQRRRVLADPHTAQNVLPGDWNQPPEPVGSGHAGDLVGLAFSGGGIRSATFNLGVLQRLAELKLLPLVDYFSTVSGGGYIGGW